ncbi:MAG TPA: PH domain-containing protein [Planctomycetaceae bacterium]
MATLVYRCPHCGASHEVDQALIGDRVDCRQCGRPFEAAAPVATPVQAEPGDAASFRVAAGEGEVEDTILEVHPSVARKHPLQFVGIWLVILVGLAAVVLGAVGEAAVPGAAPPTVLVVSGLVLAGLAGIYYAGLWLRARFTTLTVTNRRTVLRRGLIARETSEVRHRDVRNLQVNQTALERLLGVGDLAISSAGQDDLEIAVEGVPNPNRIADVIRDMQ